MFEPRRQHPVASVTNVLRTLRELLVPIIIVLILGGGGNSRLLEPSTLLVLLSVLGISGVLGWMRFHFWIEEDELRITHGIFVKKKLFIPKERIQVIDISSGLIQRMFGLVQVQVQTAGSSSSQARLSAVTLQEAKELKKLLLEDQELAEVEETASPEKIYALSTRRLLIAATTASSFGVAFSIVGYVLSQLDQFVDDEMVAQYLEGAVAQTTAGTWIIILVAAFLFAWVLSLLGTLLRYSKFSVRKRKDDLVITRGLIERKNITVPFDRIQAVRSVEGIFRQPFGYAALYVESAGYGDEGGESTVLMPLIKKSEIPDFLEDLLPEFSEPEGEVAKAPVRSIPRFVLRLFIPLTIVFGLVYLAFWDNLTAIALFYVPALLLALLRYKDTEAKTVGDHLVLQFRNLARTRAITRKHRVQAASVSANWFQRRRKLGSFRATVASGKGGRTLPVDNLEISDSNYLLNWARPT